MYVTEVTGYVGYDSETDTASEDFVIKDYTLSYTGNSIEQQDNGDDIDYTVFFDVYKDGEYVGSVNPTVQLVQSTQQQKLVASVISFPLEDLFVVYRGVNDAGDFSMDVRVNPLISLVWIGFALLMAGIVVATFGRRGARRKRVGDESQDGGKNVAGHGDAPAPNAGRQDGRRGGRRLRGCCGERRREGYGGGEGRGRGGCAHRRCPGRRGEEG